jgi:glycine cleavage system H protein
MRPTDRKYSETHEWAKIEGDTATVGITDYAVKLLGDLIYLDLPEEGDNVVKGDPCGEIESVKAASDIYSPLTGEVVAVNANRPDDLDNLAKDAFGHGWMFKVKLSDPGEVGHLKTAEEYDAFVKAEEAK